MRWAGEVPSFLNFYLFFPNWEFWTFFFFFFLSNFPPRKLLGAQRSPRGPAPLLSFNSPFYNHRVIIL